MGDSTNLPLEGLRSLVDLTGEAACLVDASTWRIEFVNSPLAQLTGIAVESIVGRRLFELAPELQDAAVRVQLIELAAGKRESARIDFRDLADHNGSPFVELRVRRVATQSGVWLAMLLETESAGAVDESSRREGIDPLTGLADRGVILDKLSRIIHGDRLEDRRCAVLFIDVDGFKQVNDVYGHLVGDGVLGEVARRLKGCLRARDCVARFGGDEFLVLLERIGGRGEIDAVVRRVQAAFARPIVLPQGEVTLGVSVGAARAGEDGNTPEALIDAADRAMYAAKRTPA
jgi:diguanylate cyclase (GGDEF)-like protein/PAS domain S-box-containing protein